MTIPTDHLRACPDHGVVADRNEPCPSCSTGVEARPDAFEDGREHPVKQTDLRWHIEPETMIELAPIVEEYVADVADGDVWISVAELPERKLPAGYTRQERWFNVLQFEAGATVKTIVQESNARETIETLREKGYGGDG